MDLGPAPQTGPVFGFGPFKLSVKERVLQRDGVPVELGARALDLLVALVSRRNESVSKRELLAEVWPDIVVEEGSLRVQIGALRKALGDAEGGARYIATLAGRGYCFVAPVTVERGEDGGATPPAPGSRVHLPARLRRMVGRDSSVLTLTALLADSRFVTIVGPGGAGKTTLAIAVAHEMLEAFAGSVTFIDLTAVNDPALVPSAVASTLGLAVQSDDPAPSLIAYLRTKRTLLILDNCEHVVDAAAALAARIFQLAPQVHLLATSRETLRVEGEQVYKVMPLAVPPSALRGQGCGERNAPRPH
jgi:DNA-binding winged helix-turn-helix (wHTH) protein